MEKPNHHADKGTKAEQLQEAYFLPEFVLSPQGSFLEDTAGEQFLTYRFDDQVDASIVKDGHMFPNNLRACTKRGLMELRSSAGVHYMFENVCQLPVGQAHVKEEDAGKHSRVLSFKEVFLPRVKLSKKHLFGEQSQALVKKEMILEGGCFSAHVYLRMKS
ncbi:ADAMTS-like protein 3, partial [Ophiophagus hannah]